MYVCVCPNPDRNTEEKTDESTEGAASRLISIKALAQQPCQPDMV